MSIEFFGRLTSTEEHPVAVTSCVQEPRAELYELWTNTLGSLNQLQ